jgi:hypothetical protein
MLAVNDFHKGVLRTQTQKQPSAYLCILCTCNYLSVSFEHSILLHDFATAVFCPMCFRQPSCFSNQFYDIR